MKETLVMYARYAQRANQAVAELYEGLDIGSRNADRGAYYGSLHGMFGHVLGGNLYFHSLFRASRPGLFPASEGIAALSAHEGSMDAEAWIAFRNALAQADAASAELASSLDRAGLETPIKLDWYGGKPAEVPLHFLFNQMMVHGVHHRGQISQILDEMKVEHDFSGIDLDFMPA